MFYKSNGSLPNLVSLIGARVRGFSTIFLDPILLSAVGEIDDSSTLPTNIIFDDEKKTDEQESTNCEVGV
jgi:hypothetical protein